MAIRLLNMWFCNFGLNFGDPELHGSRQSDNYYHGLRWSCIVPPWRVVQLPIWLQLENSLIQAKVANLLCVLPRGQIALTGYIGLLVYECRHKFYNMVWKLTLYMNVDTSFIIWFENLRWSLLLESVFNLLRPSIGMGWLILTSRGRFLWHIASTLLSFL